MREAPARRLEIHYINVEQGGGTLIVGPNGTRILYDFGNLPGGRNIGTYLQQRLGMVPGDGVDYAIVSHADRDHYMGYKDFVASGLDVKIANFEPGTSKTPSPTMRSNWLQPALKTTAKGVKAIPLGLRIALGDGAEAHVVAANGVVLGEVDSPKVRNENDRSIALFIRYDRFRYLLDGDLGGGPERCTQRDTTQRDVQTRVANALVRHELMGPKEGLSVMHVAHHGSESSTSAAYYDLVKPQVAVISVGAMQGTFLHPRQDVVERVLLQTIPTPCVKQPPVKLLLQTSRGEAKECSATGCMSFKGLAVGNIVISTNGKETFDIETEHAPLPQPGFPVSTQTRWSFPLTR